MTSEADSKGASIASPALYVALDWRMTLRTVVILTATLFTGCGDELRFNHIQVRGTELSHVPSEDSPLLDDSLPLAFYHHPLETQLRSDGVRQIDLSLEYPLGGGSILARMGTVRTRDLSQCTFASECLETIAEWSRTHRQHHPLLVILQPNAHDTLEPWMDRVESLVSDAFQPWQIITPGEVTAGYPDLRTAIAERGWPAIELSRGRTMFVLNDRGRTREAYLAGRFLDPDEPRLLFTVADNPDVPYAGVFSFPTVTAANQGQIRALVEQGYLVRAITNTEDAVQRAIDNGVHFLSTRYPDDLLPPDRLGGFPSGCNPVTTDETCAPSMIELPPR